MLENQIADTNRTTGLLSQDIKDLDRANEKAKAEAVNMLRAHQ